MDKNAELITRIVNDGTYFTMARQWYNDMFLRPMRAAAWMTGLSISLVLLVSYALWNLADIFPISKKVNVVVFLNDTINYYARLRNVDEEGKSTKQVVVEYLCSKYVEAREEYVSKKYESNYYFIVNCSSKDVFDKYYSGVETTNPLSPLILYKDKSRVDIEIISRSSDEQESKATVRFRRKIYNDQGSLANQATFEANMSFYLSKYDFTKSTGAKLDFIVTKYDVNEITI